MAALRAVLSASLGLLASAVLPWRPILGDRLPRATGDNSCASDDFVASVPLPSPLPESLQSALRGLAPMLSATVDPTYPAVSGLPQAAMLQIDYRGEPLVQVAAGDKDPKERKGPPSDTTIFRIGSASKIFPVLVAFQLYDRGVVKSLDDPLSAYLPQFSVPNRFSRSKRPVTLRQLASQLSGLPREAPCNMLGECDIATDEIVRRLKGTPGAQWPEYTEPSYSNLAYALLGNVLAEHMGVTFEAYVTENILEPLGMKDTGFTITNETKSRMALPYTNDILTPLYDVDLGWVAPSGQVHSTIADLMKLGRFLLGIEGELFDDGLRREMLLPTFTYADGSFAMGFPFETSLVKLEGEDRTWPVVAKGGNIPGYSAVVAVIPKLNLSLAGAWSGSSTVDELGFANSAVRQILPAFLPWLVSARPLPRMPSKPELYTGYFAVHFPASHVPSGEIGWNISQTSLPGKGQLLEVRPTFFPPPPEMPRLGLDFYDDRSAMLSTSGVDWPVNCFREMASSDEHMWLTFNFGADGNVESLEVPGGGGSFYGVKFQRVLRAHADRPIFTV